MEWMALILAGCFEVFGVAMLNMYKKRKEWKIIVLIALGFACSLVCLSYAMNTLPMGLTYAIWTGIGGVGGALVGMAFYGESREWKRIGFLAMIIVSVMGLKLTA